MRELPTALAFLTRIPVPVAWTGGAEVVGRSSRFFPLVGLLLGGCYWCVAQLPFPPLVTAVAILISEAFLTGALHMDGLADMGDGFGGGHTREDVLRIMKDHQIGTYGAVALLLALLLKASALAELLPAGKLWPLVFAPAAARWVTVWLSLRGPYARSSGTGAVSHFIGWTEVVWASGWVACLLVLWRSEQAWIAFVPVLLCGEFLLRWGRRKIGGVTGDVIGAATFVSEVLVLVVAVRL
jgi:cobalamin 5'-phosphate synthase/cobalamin synthase